MRVELTRRAARDLDNLPPRLQNTALKQFEFLTNDIRHPSLRAIKYEGIEDVWQGRGNRDYRFFFKIEDETYLVLTIGPHPK
jgi:mRNA-degrading endonuclease RelE of RelBE toxin-antitoxin system